MEHKDNETHKEESRGTKDVLQNSTSTGHSRGIVGRVLTRTEFLKMLY
jgi:hypothetical protein